MSLGPAFVARAEVNQIPIKFSSDASASENEPDHLDLSTLIGNCRASAGSALLLPTTHRDQSRLIARCLLKQSRTEGGVAGWEEVEDTIAENPLQLQGREIPIFRPLLEFSKVGLKVALHCIGWMVV